MPLYKIATKCILFPTTAPFNSFIFDIVQSVKSAKHLHSHTSNDMQKQKLLLLFYRFNIKTIPNRTYASAQHTRVGSCTFRTLIPLFME